MRTRPPDCVPVDSSRRWTTLVAGLLAVFAVFQWIATALGSDRGQAGLVVGLVVVAGTLAVERWWTGMPVTSAARALGLGRPRAAGLIASGAVCLLLILTIPLFARFAGASVSLYPGWLWLVPGLFAQAGIAEEVLFRGYLFGHLRCGRTFWRAAVLSMIPFVVVHLWLFATMPWPVATAAVLLAVAVSFPMAHLFELGGGTMWAPALLHFIIQGAVKVVVFPEGAAAVFPLVWMAATAAMPMLVLLVAQPAARDLRRRRCHSTG